MFSLGDQVWFRRGANGHEERGRVVGRVFWTGKYDVEDAEGNRVQDVQHIRMIDGEDV